MNNVTIARATGIVIGITMALFLGYIYCVSKTNGEVTIKWDSVFQVAFIATFTGVFCAEHVNRFLNKRQNRSGK